MSTLFMNEIPQDFVDVLRRKNKLKNCSVFGAVHILGVQSLPQDHDFYAGGKAIEYVEVPLISPVEDILDVVNSLRTRTVYVTKEMSRFVGNISQGLDGIIFVQHNVEGDYVTGFEPLELQKYGTDVMYTLPVEELK